MQNHQLAPEKYHFCDTCNERLMFRSETKNVKKNPLCMVMNLTPELLTKQEEG